MTTALWACVLRATPSKMSMYQVQHTQDISRNFAWTALDS
jgi:hypothetical protein